MGQQTRFNRKWASRPFVANGTEVIDLPIGLDIESLMISLTGTFNIATAYTAVLSEGMARLIKKIDLLLDGKTIATMPGTILTHGNFARVGGIVKVNPPVAVGEFQWGTVSGFLDLSHIGGVRAKDSVLRTMGKRQFQLHIQYGQLSDMFTGAGAAVPSLVLGVAVRETKEHGVSPDPEILRKYRYFEKAYPSSQEDRIPLDPNVLYRGVMIRTESANELSNSVLVRARVQVGSEILFDLPKAELIDLNAQDNGLYLTSGYYFIDFAPSPNGQVKVADFLDLYGHADAFLILDVAGGATNKVQIVAHEFEWIPEAVAANRQLRA